MDTILLCTLTAIVIILAGGKALLYSENPLMMAIKAYSSVLGGWSEVYMCVSVMFFAFATMVCWAHYGKESLRCLSKKKWVSALYVVVFSVFVFLGALSAPSLAWLLADLSLGVMTLINLPVLCAMRGEVERETGKLKNEN